MHGHTQTPQIFAFHSHSLWPELRSIRQHLLALHDIRACTVQRLLGNHLLQPGGVLPEPPLILRCLVLHKVGIIGHSETLSCCSFFDTQHWVSWLTCLRSTILELVVQRAGWRGAGVLVWSVYIIFILESEKKSFKCINWKAYSLAIPFLSTGFSQP